MLATERLDLIPLSVFVVAPDTLCHMQGVREVAEVNAAVITKEEVGEFEGVLGFRDILRIDMLLQSHLHQEGSIRPKPMVDTRIVPQVSVQCLDGLGCKDGVLLEGDDCDCSRDEMVGRARRATLWQPFPRQICQLEEDLLLGVCVRIVLQRIGELFDHLDELLVIRIWSLTGKSKIDQTTQN